MSQRSIQMHSHLKQHVGFGYIDNHLTNRKGAELVAPSAWNGLEPPHGSGQENIPAQNLGLHPVYCVAANMDAVNHVSSRRAGQARSGQDRARSIYVAAWCDCPNQMPSKNLKIWSYGHWNRPNWRWKSRHLESQTRPAHRPSLKLDQTRSAPG